MCVINIALRKADGKIESDTVYSEQMLTMEDVMNISEKYDCDVMACQVGVFIPFDHDNEEQLLIDKNDIEHWEDASYVIPKSHEMSVFYNRPKSEKEEQDDEEGQLCDSTQPTANVSQ